MVLGLVVEKLAKKTETQTTNSHIKKRECATENTKNHH